MTTFTKLLHECGASNTEGLAREVETRYRESHRHYHTLVHIEEMLSLAAKYMPHDCDSRSLQLAIWFHDVIYDPTRQDNEAASAQFLKSRLSDLSISSSIVNRAFELVMVTDHSREHPLRDSSAWDVDLLLDADLERLAAPPDRFRELGEAIRREYSDVPEAVYRPGRAKILQHFLDLPHIYRHPEIHFHLEQAARANLIAEVNRLSG